MSLKYLKKLIKHNKDRDALIEQVKHLSKKNHKNSDIIDNAFEDRIQKGDYDVAGLRKERNTMQEGYDYINEDFTDEEQRIRDLNDAINRRSSISDMAPERSAYAPETYSKLTPKTEKKATDSLRAVKNYPSKNLEENRLFRDNFERFKNNIAPYGLDNAPDVWKEGIRSKTMEKFEKLKKMMKK